MAYRRYKLTLLFRVTILFLTLSALAYAINFLDFEENLPISLLVIVPIIGLIILSIRNLFKLTVRRFTEMDDFFESIKYRDFSRWFNESVGPQDIRELRIGFNKVNNTFKLVNKEKEAQHLYLQKILELVDTGIIAYNIETGTVLWINDSFKNILNVPSLKYIQFVEERKPKVFETVFKTNHAKGNTVSIDNGNSKIQILVSSTEFNIEEEDFRLIVLQNIDDSLNQTESEAWKKLLSVMTHEIMNSIAPISSLAETLQNKVRASIETPEEHPLIVEDLRLSIESIRSRSEGLMKFARTYRGLNKITKLNVSEVSVTLLLSSIANLLQPSLDQKNIELEFVIDTLESKITIDRHLIEQVLINLMLNAIEACKNSEQPKIILSAEKNIHGNTIIKVIDNGGGIPEEILENIFIPFFTTKKNGTGIGLSLCKQIMLMHKGKIQIKTQEGSGTIMSLIF